MKITYEFLKQMNACKLGMDFVELNIPDNTELSEFLVLLTDNHLDWQNWLITRLLTKENCIRYAIFAAEKVLGNYEKIYPNDLRPRKAIETTKVYLDNPSEENRSAYLAYSAACAAAARSAARSADSAYSAADSAARSADSAAYSVTYKEIINYGLQLLMEIE